MMVESTLLVKSRKVLGLIEPRIAQKLPFVCLLSQLAATIFHRADDIK